MKESQTARWVLVLMLTFLMPMTQLLAEDCPSDKLALWTGKKLHGANIAFPRNPGGAANGIGDGDFVQSDFDDLRRAGANYVQLSHAGTFAESSPYTLDSVAEANLDLAIQRAMSAGMYIVIAFRSGPGRSETAISNRDGIVNESIWSSSAARSAWVQMLKHTAARYQGNPAVIGYSIMVEPNAYARRGFIDPPEFYAAYRGALDDVNGLYSLATSAIREVDSDTPILLEPDGYANINWLPYLSITGDPRTVYTAHDYTPYDFTHEQVAGSTYPGMYDVDGDGARELVDKSYLTNYLNAVAQFGQAHSVAVAITEFGVHRPATSSATYLNDRIDIQNAIGSWAVWVWQPAGFEDPFSVHDPSALLDVLSSAWSTNCTPTFEQPTVSSGMLAGRAFSQSRKALKGVKIAAGGSSATSAKNGKYGLVLTTGTYSTSATYRGRNCKVGSARGPKNKSIAISADTQTTLNVYCPS